MTQDRVVYLHIRDDTGLVFYVGYGSLKRAKSKNGRNSWWNRIIKKTTYKVEIYKDNLTATEAKKIEIELIAKYKNNGVELCNLTNGGDGRLGNVHSNEWKKKISLSLIGNSRSLGKPFKEPIIALNLSDNSTLRFAGKKSIENHGYFLARQVYRCASRDKICHSYSQGIHKGYKFYWESEFLKETRNPKLLKQST